MKVEKCRKLFKKEDKEFKKNKDLFAQELRNYVPDSDVSEDEAESEDKEVEESQDEDEEANEDKLPEEEEEKQVGPQDDDEF